MEGQLLRIDLYWLVWQSTLNHVGQVTIMVCIYHAYPFKERLLYIIQNVFKTILWLNEKLIQHIECYTERFGHRCLAKIFLSFTYLLNLLLSNGRSRSFMHANQIFGGNYLPFVNGRTTLNHRSRLTSMTVCIESGGTGDISSRIMPPPINDSKLCILPYLQKF